MDYAPFSLFMDNLQVHRMNVVRDACEDNRITRVWNIAHCPQFNCKFNISPNQVYLGIESVFS